MTLDNLTAETTAECHVTKLLVTHLIGIAAMKSTDWQKFVSHMRANSLRNLSRFEFQGGSAQDCQILLDRMGEIHAEIFDGLEKALANPKASPDRFH